MFGEGNGQLPLPPLLMIDRIRHISSEGGLFDKGEIVGDLDLTPDLWFFAAHSEVTGDARLLRLGCPLAAPRLLCRVVRRCRARAGIGGRQCADLDGVEIYTAKSLRVGLFSSPEPTLDLMGRPGDRQASR